MKTVPGFTNKIRLEICPQTQVPYELYMVYLEKFTGIGCS